ncbi:MAG: hypothetical protein ACRCZP_05785 [Phycicoccus sp.]
MAPPHVRKHKIITLDVGGEDFAVQLREYALTDETDEGDRLYTFAPDGEFEEETDPVWNLELTLLSDWRVNGVSDFMFSHHNEVVPFQLDINPDVPGEHVRFTGSLKIKAPTVGGEARTTATHEVTFPLLNFDPSTAYSRP